MEPQGDGVYKVREYNNGEKIIQVWRNCAGKYLREVKGENEQIIFTKTEMTDKNGYHIREGNHLENIINMPKDSYGWYRRFTEDKGEKIIFQKV